jgi:hypothetical protein
MATTEVFRSSYGYCRKCSSLSYTYGQVSASEVPCQNCGDGTKVPLLQRGWFYWFCEPGCLPDSEPFGPFSTFEEADDDAKSTDYVIVDDEGIAHTYTEEDEKLHGD